ncbi:MAG TPA: discoidin domain-containing protein, partial [Longimicrobiaceae bacterium]|nr:discoidin domain-containing protein [Longimicrobiaceae bacterium]
MGVAVLLLALIPACAPASVSPGPPPAAALPSAPANEAPSSLSARVIDDFETPGGWTAVPSEGVELRISQDSGFSGKAMRLDFDFHGGAGYAIARRALPLVLPANWEFAFRLRARAPVNDLEFKLVDPSGENVWWLNRRRFEYPADWQRLRTQKRQVQFAWGPRGGGELDRMGALEIVITAGTGGKGTVWIDDLTFREREAPSAYTLTPALAASASAPGSAPALALDGDSATAWRAGGAAEATLALDFLRERELGGLALLWDAAHRPAAYRVERSDDGATWEEAYAVEGASGPRDPIYLPETDTRHLRLRIPAQEGGEWALREVVVHPPEWSATPNAYFASLAAEAPRGRFPRYLTGEQSYWTVVGVSGDTREATLSADGTAETGIGGPSLEPFLLLGGRLLSW